MNRKGLMIALTLVALTALCSFASAAFASEKAVKTSTAFAAEYGGGEYFGPENTLHCTGKHKTNSLKYPGSGGRGGEDIEKCKLSAGETFPTRWQVVGSPINIDDNYWGSDFDGQEVPFMEELPAFGVISSKVVNDHTFKVKVVFPDS
jgi:hypothetical protein